jgi:beta-glucosidase
MGGGSGWGIPSYILSGAAVMQHEARRGAFDINLDASDGYMNLSNFRMQARASEAALVFVNAWSTEGNDRPNITLFGGGDRLVKAAASECNNTIVVINSGGVVLVEDWIKHENVTAVLYAGFPGQEGAGALPAILFGDKSPSGKLPFTWGRSLDQYLPNSIARVPDIAPVANFDEG